MADLLEKFGNVKVDVTSKISESDKAACLIMQEAYDKACESLKQLRTMGKMHIAGQKRVTESLPSGVISDYLGDVCNINKINYHVELARMQFEMSWFLNSIIMTIITNTINNTRKKWNRCIFVTKMCSSLLSLSSVAFLSRSVR